MFGELTFTVENLRHLFQKLRESDLREGEWFQMWRCGLTDDHCPILALILGWIKFEKVHLNGNKIGDKGCRILGECFSNNPCLELNLRKNAFGYEGACELGSAFMHDATLVGLSVAGNNIGDAGLVSLLAAFGPESALKEIDIEWTGWGLPTIKMLCERICTNGMQLNQIELGVRLSDDEEKRLNEMSDEEKQQLERDKAEEKRLLQIVRDTDPWIYIDKFQRLLPFDKCCSILAGLRDVHSVPPHSGQKIREMRDACNGVRHHVKDRDGDCPVDGDGEIKTLEEATKFFDQVANGSISFDVVTRCSECGRKKRKISDLDYNSLKVVSTLRAAAHVIEEAIESIRPPERKVTCWELFYA